MYEHNTRTAITIESLEEVIGGTAAANDDLRENAIRAFEQMWAQNKNTYIAGLKKRGIIFSTEEQYKRFVMMERGLR